MNKILTGIIVILFFMWVGVLNAEQKEIIGKDGASMVFIPAGEFTMGSSQSDGAAYENPGHPVQHSVFLSIYYIDKYEVTVSQYRKFCQKTGRSMPEAPDWGWQDNHPIVNVSWSDAVAYANYYGKRLLTEAEWEKAARAGSTTRYYFKGTEANLKDYAWYSANSNNQTHSVGTKKPNAFGIFDMYGNVFEWCSDWYGENYYASSPTSNPKGPDSSPYDCRVLRGGGWNDSAGDCRSAGRFGVGPVGRSDDLGFRCASSP